MPQHQSSAILFLLSQPSAPSPVLPAKAGACGQPVIPVPRCRRSGRRVAMVGFAAGSAVAAARLLPAQACVASRQGLGPRGAGKLPGPPVLAAPRALASASSLAEALGQGTPLGQQTRWTGRSRVSARPGYPLPPTGSETRVHQHVSIPCSETFG